MPTNTVEKLAQWYLTARVPTSDPVDDIARSVSKWVTRWWQSDVAREMFEWQMARKQWNIKSFDEWKDLFMEEIEILTSPDQVMFTIHNKLNPFSEELKAHLETYMPRRGWFLKTNDESLHLTKMTFETRRGVRVPEVEVPKYLWHTTKIENAKAILKKGLLPKSLSNDLDNGDPAFENRVLVRHYPDRIYLADSEAAVEKIRDMLWQYHVRGDNDIESIHHGNFDASPFVVFRIDTSKLRKGTKFYKDPDFAPGVYTYTPIPPSALDLRADGREALAEYEERLRQVDDEPYGRAAAAKPKAKPKTKPKPRTRVVDGEVLRNMADDLAYEGIIIRKRPSEWLIYHKNAGVGLVLYKDGSVYPPEEIADKYGSGPIASVFRRGARQAILDFFANYMPEPDPLDTIQYVRGDLLSSDCDIIAHGCNCFNSMSGGIARHIAKKFPEAQRADDATEPGDEAKIGSFTYTHGKPAVFNLYTQYQPGPAVDYAAIKVAFKKLHRHLKAHNMLDLKIGIPKIGAGIAGGDWGRIESIIRSVWGDEGPIYVYVYP
jgi:O-acetyl-ADP-ribose deacetylase (regulator of RNase III)